MSYITKYLACDSYKDLFNECEKVGLVNDGEIITASHNHHLLLLPDLSKPTGTILEDEDGNEYPEMVKLEGYHANLKYKEDVGLNHLSIEIETPLVM